MEPEYRFNIDDPKWKRYLLDTGFVVLKYLSADEATQYLDRMWVDIEELSGGKVNKNDPTTRTRASNYPYMMHGGMIQYLGHSQVQWDIRERVAPIFADLYGTRVEDLSTSFDGLCFMDGMRGYRAQPDTSFIHVDQSPQRKYLYSIQGMLNLVDSGPNDGGFVAVPYSHLYTEWWEINDVKCRDDWYLFTQEQKRADPMFEQSIKVCARAGDFILWDSRTWHCNTTPKTQQVRSVVYACMLPKKLVPDAIKKKRSAAVREQRVSTHHPGTGFRLFPKTPRWCGPGTYQRALTIQQRTVLTPIQKILGDLEDAPG